MKRVFLGGTCNGSKWRDEAIDLLLRAELDFYNPVVDDWNEAAQKKEIKEREICDFCLYVITPKMTGVYAIAEIIDDSNNRPEKTVFVVVSYDGADHFSSGQIRSLNQVGAMVERNGGVWHPNITRAVNWIKSQ